MSTADALSAMSLDEFDQLLARGVFQKGVKVELDFNVKAQVYCDDPLIAHYLVIDPATERLTHHDYHRQQADEYALESDARLVLEPPGLELPVRALLVREMRTIQDAGVSSATDSRM